MRDKIAASKKKGMWMGGVCPIGYDVHARSLVVNEAGAETVRLVFKLYLELGSALVLEAALRKHGIVSKRRVDRAGKVTGGKPFSRGALYLLLRNPLYVGRVRHREQTYAGQHEAIVEVETFEATQRMLDTNSVTRRGEGPGIKKSGCWLVGRLFDQHGRRMSPSHTNKGGKRYSYYVSRTDLPETAQRPIIRVPAGEIQSLVISRLQTFLLDSRVLLDLLDNVFRHPETLQRALNAASDIGTKLGTAKGPAADALARQFIARVDIGPTEVEILLDLRPLVPTDEGENSLDGALLHQLTVPARLGRRTREVRLMVPRAHSHAVRKDAGMIKLLVRAHEVRKAFDANDLSLAALAGKCGYNVDYCTVLLKLSYLAPDITTAILNGRHPQELTRQRLARIRQLPFDWEEQRRVLGFAAVQ